MADALVDALRKTDDTATKGPWATRRRDEDKKLEVHTTDGGHGYLDVCIVQPWLAHDEYNAALIVALRNALPALLVYVQAADDLAAEYAHCLNERDGVQRELDPYDAARAALATAIEGGK